MLETYLRERRQERDILLMTHLVLGHPDLDTSLRVIEVMVEAGVDLIELQIPFSEPMADGPVILHANQHALEAGTTVDQCLEFGRKVSERFDVPFLFMTYYNILFRRGTARFVRDMAERGLRGAIVPDLPPEEGEEYLTAMQQNELAPVFIFSPSSSEERMRTIAAQSQGFVYCVARKGVTGAKTAFSAGLDKYLERCRIATTLPLAVGFGVKERLDVDFLRGKADIAVVGSQTIRILEADGITGVDRFIRSLRD